jgi:hypothetical protein
MEQLESTQAAIAPAGHDLMRSHLADAELARLKALRDARVRALLAHRTPHTNTATDAEIR